VRILIFIGVAGLLFTFYAGYTGTAKSQNKSVAGKSVEGAFNVVGVVVVIVGFLIFLWLLSLFTPGPEDLPSPQDYAP
jgi:amino acid transporter